MRLALPNLKAFVTHAGMIVNSYVLDVSQRWGLRAQLQFKLLNGLRLTFYLNPDILRSVANPSLKIMFNSQSVDEGPEADPLNDAADTDRS